MKMLTNNGSCDDLIATSKNRKQDCIGQDQKLAQYFYENTDENDKHAQFHRTSTPLPFSSEESKFTSSIHPGPPQYEPNVEQIEPEAKMPAPFTETTMQSMFNNSSSPNENPNENATLLPAQKTDLPVLEHSSLNGHSIIVSQDKLIFKQTELEAQPALPTEMSYLVPTHSQTFTEDCTVTENSSPTDDDHLLVRELISSYLDLIIPNHQPNAEQIDPEAPMSLTEMTTDPVFSNIESHIDNSTDGENSLSNQNVQPSVQDLLSPTLDIYCQSNCKCPNCSNSNKTKGLKNEVQHICHVFNCGKLFSNSQTLERHLAWHCGKKNFFCAQCNKGFVHKDQLIMHLRKHSNGKKTKCQCPNCSADSGNKKRGSNGKLQHICHLAECEKVFYSINALKRHLASHKGKKSSAFPHRNTRSAHRDNASGHVKKIYTKASQYLPTTNDIDRQLSHETNLKSRPLLPRNTHPLDLLLLQNDKKDSADTTITSLVRTPPSELLTSMALPSPQSSINESCFVDPVNTASASQCTSDNESIVQHSLATRQNTLRKESTSTVEAEKPKKRVRQSECRCPYCSEEGGNKTKGPNGKPQHICHFSHCGKIFGYARSLYRHLKLHSGQKNYVCAHCSKGFVREDSLKVHVLTHMTDKRNKGRWVKCKCANCIKGGEKADCLEKKWRYVCHYPDCGRAYTQIGNLQRHLQLHSGKKSFNCAHCDKGYARKDLLVWHMKIHMNEGRKWARCRCPYCSIDGHVKVRAPGGKLQHICHIPGCQNVYNNSWQLKRHLESHSGKKNYFCPNCGKGFARQDSFDRHVKRYSKAEQKKVNRRPKHVCPVINCGRFFKSVTSLKSHLKCHNTKNDSEGSARKSKLGEQDRRSINAKRNEPEKINGADSQITDNEQATSASKQVNIQYNRDRYQIACNIDGCGEIYNSIRLLSAHLKYYHSI